MLLLTYLHKALCYISVGLVHSRARTTSLHSVAGDYRMRDCATVNQSHTLHCKNPTRPRPTIRRQLKKKQGTFFSEYFYIKNYNDKKLSNPLHLIPTYLTNIYTPITLTLSANIMPSTKEYQNISVLFLGTLSQVFPRLSFFLLLTFLPGSTLLRM